MIIEPTVKRAVAFIDGQNLFYSTKESFGYSWPNFDPKALAKEVCRAKGWDLLQTRFYTGIPDPGIDPLWNRFWIKKLAYLGSRGVCTCSRPLRYRHETVKLADGTEKPITVGREKGVDIRIALDIVNLALNNGMDVLRALHRSDQQVLDVGKLVFVDVDQFHGIEIEEFPAQIAQVALWLTDH